MNSKNIRVIHYGLGPIGAETARLVLKKPRMEIVGAVDISKDMAGKDLGNILELERELGIVVTDNGRQLLSGVKADVVIHTTGSRIKNIFSQLIEIVDTGINVVSSAEELLFPLSENAQLAKELDLKATKNGVTVLGTGVNPGFVMDSLPIFMTAVCQDVKKIHIERVVDAATRRHPLQKKIGAGMTPVVFRAKIDEKSLGHVGLLESFYFIADRLSLSIDEVKETVDPVMADSPVKTDYFDLKTGDIVGVKHIVEGIKDGEKVISLDLRMYIGADDPHDSVSIVGTPNLNLRIEGGVAGDQATAAILVNSIPAVIEAAPGLTNVKALPSPYFYR